MITHKLISKHSMGAGLSNLNWVLPPTTELWHTLMTLPGKERSLLHMILVWGLNIANASFKQLLEALMILNHHWSGITISNFSTIDSNPKFFLSFSTTMAKIMCLAEFTLLAILLDKVKSYWLRNAYLIYQCHKISFSQLWRCQSVCCVLMHIVV